MVILPVNYLLHCEYISYFKVIIISILSWFDPIPFPALQYLIFHSLNYSLW